MRDYDDFKTNEFRNFPIKCFGYFKIKICNYQIILSFTYFFDESMKSGDDIFDSVN